MKKLLLIFSLLESQFSFAQAIVLNPDSLCKINYSNFFESNYCKFSKNIPLITDWSEIACGYGYSNYTKGTQIHYKKEKVIFKFQKDTSRTQFLKSITIESKKTNFITWDSIKVGDELDINLIDSGLIFFKKSVLKNNEEFRYIGEIYFKGFFYRFRSVDINKFALNPRIRVSSISFGPYFYNTYKNIEIMYWPY